MNDDLAKRFEAVDSARSLRAACLEGGRMVLRAIRSGEISGMKALRETIDAAEQQANPKLREFSLLTLWHTFVSAAGDNPHDVSFRGKDEVFVGEASKDVRARAWNYASVCRSLNTAQLADGIEARVHSRLEELVDSMPEESTYRLGRKFYGKLSARESAAYFQAREDRTGKPVTKEERHFEELVRNIRKNLK